MTKPLERGELAKNKYNEVRYSHIPIRPGQPAVLTADPWAFLHGALLQKINHSRGNNREKFQRANYYARLAEDFYSAAKATELPSKGTLLYYGMLNLTKCLLSVNGVPLETTHEYHGLKLPLGTKFQVEVAGTPSNAISIFEEFCKLLGTPINGKHVVELKDAFTHIPELHSVCADLNFMRRKKFLPIKIDFLVNKKRDYLFTEVVFDKKHEQPLLTSRFLKDRRAQYFKEGFPRDGAITYRSKARKRLNDWDRVYANVLKEYERFNIASILTRAGYTYYCDLSPGQYHHLAYSLLTMFYLGTAARYRPTEVEEVMSGEFRPLANETSAICPKQFLYQIASRVTERVCVIPFADF